MKFTLKPADIGTVSNGTMRDVDLLLSFSNALNALRASNIEFLRQPEARDMSHAVNSALAVSLDWQCKNLYEMSEADEDAICEFINMLFVTLDLFSPPGCYFGAHEGNGSDYGFWPVPDMDMNRSDADWLRYDEFGHLS